MSVVQLKKHSDRHLRTKANKADACRVEGTVRRLEPKLERKMDARFERWLARWKKKRNAKRDALVESS